MSKRKKNRLIMRSVILAIMAAAIVYTLYASITKDKRVAIKVGDKAPDFILSDMEGNQFQLSDYKGKGVFLNFWGTWCKPCEKEMPYMNNQYKVYKDQGIEILAVNLDKPDYLVKNFIKKHDLVFPILRDRNGDVKDEYNIYLLPATLLIDPEGYVIEIEEGELTEARIISMMESIKPK